MKHRPLDTTPEAAWIQAAAQAELGPAGRLAVALDLSEATRALRIAGLRQQYPNLSELELVEVFVRQCHGIELESLR